MFIVSTLRKKSMSDMPCYFKLTWDKITLEENNCLTVITYINMKVDQQNIAKVISLQKMLSMLKWRCWIFFEEGVREEVGYRNALHLALYLCSWIQKPFHNIIHFEFFIKSLFHNILGMYLVVVNTDVSFRSHASGVTDEQI